MGGHVLGLSVLVARQGFGMVKVQDDSEGTC